MLRLRHTVPQVGLNPKERRDNVKGAFGVSQPAAVKGKKILLIDDLYTTGSTVRECARVLRRAGAARVEVLTVARVKHALIRAKVFTAIMETRACSYAVPRSARG